MEAVQAFFAWRTSQLPEEAPGPLPAEEPASAPFKAPLEVGARRPRRPGRRFVLLALAAAIPPFIYFVGTRRTAVDASNPVPAFSATASDVAMTGNATPPIASAGPGAATSIELTLAAPAPILRVSTADLVTVEGTGTRAVRLWVRPWSGTLLVEAAVAGAGTGLARFREGGPTEARVEVPSTLSSAPGSRAQTMSHPSKPPSPKASPPPSDLHGNPYQ